MRNQFYPLIYSLISGVLVSCNGNKLLRLTVYNFPLTKMAISPFLTEKRSKVGVDMVKNKFHLNGPSKTVVLNSMGVVLEKLKIVTVVT